LLYIQRINTWVYPYTPFAKERKQFYSPLFEREGAGVSYGRRIAEKEQRRSTVDPL
jgi:hypothetical protein